MAGGDHEGLNLAPNEGHAWLFWDCQRDLPEELGPLGQCLQPDHTLTPVPIQGGERPPCLQAPDVHQPAQGPVQASAGAGSGGSTAEGGHVQHTPQGWSGGHTAGGPGVLAA